MTKSFITITVLAVAIDLAVSVQLAAHESTAMPAKISKDEFSGKIFERPDMVEDTEGFTQIWVIYSEDGSGLE